MVLFKIFVMFLIVQTIAEAGVISGVEPDQSTVVEEASSNETLLEDWVIVEDADKVTSTIEPQQSTAAEDKSEEASTNVEQVESTATPNNDVPVEGVESVPTVKPDDQFLLQVAIVEKNSYLTRLPCSAALIKENYVVTNARCVLDNATYVVLDFVRGVERSINISNIYIHEKYNTGSEINREFDIAVVQLAEKLEPNRVLNVSEIKGKSVGNAMIGYQSKEIGKELVHFYVDLDEFCNETSSQDNIHVPLREWLFCVMNYEIPSFVEDGNIVLVEKNGNESALIGLSIDGKITFMKVSYHFQWIQNKTSSAVGLTPGYLLLTTAVISYLRKMFN